MSSDLPASMLRSLVVAIEALGLDARPAVERLGRSRSRTSPWDEFLVALEGFFSEEGVSQTQRLMQVLATRSSPVVAASELLADPRQTYLVLLEAAAVHQNFVKVEFRPAASGALAVQLDLNKGQRPSMVFFQSCAWFLAAVPRARGLVEARVLPARLSERELSCLVLPPAEVRGVRLSHSEVALRAHAHRLVHKDLAPEGSAQRSAPSSQVLQRRFGLTLAEARVVRRLAEGRSIKRIAEELGVSPETARTHAKRAMQKTDTHRQAELVSLVLQSER